MANPKMPTPTYAQGVQDGCSRGGMLSPWASRREPLTTGSSVDEMQEKKDEHDTEQVGEDVAKGRGAAADVLVHGITSAATGIAAGVDALHDSQEKPDR